MPSVSRPEAKKGSKELTGYRSCPNLQGSICRAKLTLRGPEPRDQPSALFCLHLAHSPHQPVAVLEKITGEDPAGGIYHRLFHEVVVADGRRRVQGHLGSRARGHRQTPNQSTQKDPRDPSAEPCHPGHSCHPTPHPTPQPP